MKVTLIAERDGACAELPCSTFCHVGVIRSMVVDLGEADDFEYTVNFWNQSLLDFSVDFLQQHADDELVPDNWKDLPPRPLTEWDQTQLKPIVGIELLHLMRGASQLGCQLLLNAVGGYLAPILAELDEPQVQDYFGVHIELTKEHEDRLREIYPQAFV